MQLQLRLPEIFCMTAAAACCNQVAFRPLAFPEVAAAASVLADQGLLGLGTGREERLLRVTLRISAEDVAAALADSRLLRGCLSAVVPV